MKNVFSVVVIVLMSLASYSQVYLAKSCEISFFSANVIENIDAMNKSAKPVVNTATGEVLVKVPVKSFQFKSQLMQDHFNEDYMETDKYPFAIFSGKINQALDYTKDTTYQVTVSGTMNMHGVEKKIETNGSVIVSHGILAIETKFNVRIADYNIKVPSLYVKNISEEVEVKLSSVLERYKKS